MMELRQRIVFGFVYLTLAAYGLLAPYLITRGVLDLRNGNRDRRNSIRLPSRSSRSSDRTAAFQKRGWANTWLPGNVRGHRI